MKKLNLIYEFELIGNDGIENSIMHYNAQLWGYKNRAIPNNLKGEQLIKRCEQIIHNILNEDFTIYPYFKLNYNSYKILNFKLYEGNNEIIKKGFKILFLIIRVKVDIFTYTN